MNYHVILFVDSSMLGGIETHIVELSKLLSKNNVRSSILFYKNHGNQKFYDLLIKENIRYDFLQGKIKNLANKLLSYDNNTVVHTHGYKAGILGRLVCNIINKRCISTYHAGEVGNGKVKYYNKLDQWLSSLSINFAVSNKIKNTISNVKLLENFISLPAPSKPVIHTSTIKIGFVGRLSYEKGPDIFFQLAENMKQSNNVEFHIFGDGPLKNKIPVINNLHYHGLTERNNIWNQIDVLLICSREEGLPMTLLEAMSQHKLVISSAVGAIPSIIKNNKTGFLMSVGDAKDCQKSIEQLIDFPPQAKVNLLNNAYNMLEERFSGKKQFLLLHQAYTGK